MNDLIFVGVFAAFMIVAFGYIQLCDRIVRADQDADRPITDPASTEEQDDERVEAAAS